MSLSFHCQHRFVDGFELHADFQAEQQCTVLFGPSGSGKTSILSIIAGLLDPRKGKVAIGDTVLLETEESIYLPPEKRNVGYVLQDALLFPHMNVLENLKYALRFRSAAGSPALDRVVDVLRIKELLERSPQSLSGGEAQRVALGRALVSGPELLLMDEPLSSLDSELKMSVLGYLKSAIEEWRILAIYVTHSQREADFIADRILHLENGRVVQEA